jgi:hypothetical protein
VIYSRTGSMIAIVRGVLTSNTFLTSFYSTLIFMMFSFPRRVTPITSQKLLMASAV